MILHALTDCCGALAAKEEGISPPGWCDAAVSFSLELSAEGEIRGVVPQFHYEPRGKKTVQTADRMSIPGREVRTAGVKANFMCDNSAYLLGFNGKGNPERSRECFEAAKALNHLLADREHKKQIGDATVVYWAEQADRVLQSTFSLFAFPEEDSEGKLAGIMKNLTLGLPVKDVDMSRRFYVLGRRPTPRESRCGFSFRIPLAIWLKICAATMNGRTSRAPSSTRGRICPFPRCSMKQSIRTAETNRHRRFYRALSCVPC